MQKIVFLFILTLSIFILPVRAGIGPTAAELKSEGNIAFNNGNFTEALKKFTYAMEKALDSPHDDTTYIRSVGNIAIIYSLYGDSEQSLRYIEKAYNYAKQKKNYTLQSRSAINMVGISCELKDLDKAEHYYEIEKELAPKDKDKNIANYYLIYNRGMLFQLRGNYDMAAKEHQAALDFASSHNMGSRYKIGQYYELGKCQFIKKDYTKAAHYTRLALTSPHFALEENNTRILVYKQMADIYTALGRVDSANYYTGLRTHITDSVLDMKEFSKAKEILIKYEQQENERRNNRQTMLILLVVAPVIAIITFILVHVMARKKIKNQNEANKKQIAALEMEHKKDMEEKEVSVRKQEEQLARQAAEMTQRENVAVTTTTERAPIGLPTRQVEILYNNILDVMNQTDVIISPDFSLSDLAKRVKSNTKYVSWVINEKFEMNFKQLLNLNRINEAARRLHDTTGEYSNYTIEAVAHSVGFNSQSSFIEAFKNIMGVTPKQYKQQK